MARQSKTGRTAQGGTRPRRAPREGSWIQKNEALLMAMLLVVSLTVIVAIAFPDLIGWQAAGATGSISNEPGEGMTINWTAPVKLSTAECLAGYGLNPKTVIYIYSESCAASQGNTPWVTALKDKGYDIFMADATDVNAMAMVSSCLPGIAEFGGTPEYVCPATAKSRLGAFDSESELGAFIDSCK